MDTLRFVERDGVKFYCFIESCNVLFTNTPKSTVRNWTKTLQIPTLLCSPEERAHFRRDNPSLSGCFGLISHNDLARLICFQSSRPPLKRVKLDSTTTSSSNSSRYPPVARVNSYVPVATVNNSTPINRVCITSSNNEESQQASVNESLDSVNESLDSVDEILDSVNESLDSVNESFDSVNSPIITPSSNINIIQHQREVVHDIISDDDCDATINVNIGKDADINAKSVRKTVLSLEEAPASLKAEVNSLRQFYTKPLNPSRTVEPFAICTVNKLIERLMGFMFFCLRMKNISNLSLKLVSDVSLFTSFIEHLRDERKLMPSTLSNYLSAAINVVKYNIVLEDQNADPDNSPKVRSYRQFIRQFQRENYRLTKRKKEGLCTQYNQKFYFVHILETLRKLRDKYFETKGLVKARFLHDFVMLALYIRANPGRSKEIRTLKLYLECEKQKPFNFDDFQTENYIVFEQGLNVVYLVQSDFKNARSSGPTRTDVTEDKELVYYLKLYLGLRPSLMLGRSHDFFFLNTYGEGFSSSSAIAKYIGGIFFKEISIKVSTNALRHALVTHFCSNIDDFGDSNIRRSLASLMKHSMRYQELVYNDQSHDEKTRASRHILRTQVAPNIFGEEDFTDSKGDATVVEDDLGDGFNKLLPQIGDIVALLDGVSTKDSIHFFLAKIARYNKTRSEAHLSQLELVDNSDNMYVLKPNSVWVESVNALIFPIDILYNSSKHAYELRTSPEQIFKCVHK